MMRSLLVLVVLASLGTALGPAAAEPVFPTGLRVGLEPPANAVLSTRFPGFEDADRKVVITILDLPGGAYTELEAAVFGKNQPGLKDFKRETFAFDNGIGFLVTGTSEQNGVTLRKWFLLTTAAVGGRVNDLTALVTVEVPESAASVYSDAVVRKVLQSIAFRPPPVEEQMKLMPFKLGDMAGFRVMQVMPAGGVILSDGPSDNINNQPYMIISVGRGGPSEPSDRSRFARDLLASSPMQDMTVQSAEAMRIGGAPGHEVRATAKGAHGEALSMVQWLRFGSGGFLRIIGVGRTDAWDTLFTRFRAVRDGIEAK